MDALDGSRKTQPDALATPEEILAHFRHDAAETKWLGFALVFLDGTLILDAARDSEILAELRRPDHPAIGYCGALRVADRIRFLTRPFDANSQQHKIIFDGAIEQFASTAQWCVSQLTKLQDDMRAHGVN